MSVDTDLATLRESLSFFVSVIRSGEAFTETVMAQDIDASSALARVEAELSRLREQRDAALLTSHVGGQPCRAWRQAREREKTALLREKAAEARLGEARQECARLQQERDALIERDFWASQTIREQEAELVRLREMLARVRPDIDPETGYGRVEAI